MLDIVYMEIQRNFHLQQSILKKENEYCICVEFFVRSSVDDQNFISFFIYTQVFFRLFFLSSYNVSFDRLYGIFMGFNFQRFLLHFKLFYGGIFGIKYSVKGMCFARRV